MLFSLTVRVAEKEVYICVKAVVFNEIFAVGFVCAGVFFKGGDVNAQSGCDVLHFFLRKLVNGA